MSELRPLRVGWIHPDLGIGGAERLVVDAACSLQDLGHAVDIYTSHWDPSRCFEETNDGTLSVTVLGNALPVSLRGRFHIVLAILRQLHLTFTLLYRTWFSASFAPPDIYVVDQLSACIPLLRWFTRTRVVFYCHFPDLLLSPGRSGFDGGVVGQGRRSLLRMAYRVPVDALEEATTSQADRILVNSNFTATMFKSVFPQVHRQLQIVYPGIDAKSFGITAEADELASNRPTLLSINRFEAKKNVLLAIEAFAIALERKAIPENTRLIIGGGYDERVQSCVDTLQQLQRICKVRGLSHSTTSLGSDVQVLFLTNLSNKQKVALMQAESTKCLLYTPSLEHLGIVPLEAMGCGLPIIASNSGGPLETIVEGKTGLLRASQPAIWADAIAYFVGLDVDTRQAYREEGKLRVKAHFDLPVLGRNFERAIRDVLVDGEQGRLPDIYAEPAFLKSVTFVILSLLCFVTIVFMIRHTDLYDNPRIFARARSD